MAYTKQQWVDNTTPVDAAHMNHIEDGIGDIDIVNILNTQNRIGSVFNNAERNIDNYNNDSYCGVWWANGAGTAVTGTFPGTAKVGVLIIKRHSPQYLYQYFLDINALAFYRYYDKNSSTWIDWRETQGTTILQNTNVLGAAQRFGFVALTNGQELNTLTNVGIYSANTNAIAQSVIPSPFDTSFKLIVEKMQSNSNNYTVQTAIKVGTYEIARRITLNNGSSWTNWVKQPTREEVEYLQNNGVKNLFGPLYNVPFVTTSSGVDYTLDVDGGVTAVGTATGTSFINCGISTGKFSVPKGVPLRLTGSDGNVNILVAYFEGTTTVKYAGTDSGNGVDFTIPNTATQSWLRVATPNGKTVNSKVYPMVTVRNIQDDTYQPYAMSNAELTGKKGIFTVDNENVTMTLTDIYQMGNMVFVRLYGIISTGVGNTDNLIGTISGVGLPRNSDAVARTVIDLGGNQVYQSGGYGYGAVAQNGKVYIKSATHDTFKSFKINIFYSIL